LVFVEDGSFPHSTPPISTLTSLNLSPQQLVLFLILTLSTNLGPPLNEAFHHIPTPFLVIAIPFSFGRRALSALYEPPAEYGLFIDGFSSSTYLVGPDGTPVVLVVVVVVVVDDDHDHTPVQASIPEIDRYSFLVVLSSSLSPVAFLAHVTVYHCPFFVPIGI
jgi:hypothetical protein